MGFPRGSRHSDKRFVLSCLGLVESTIPTLPPNEKGEIAALGFLQIGIARRLELNLNEFSFIQDPAVGRLVAPVLEQHVSFLLESLQSDLVDSGKDEDDDVNLAESIFVCRDEIEDAVIELERLGVELSSAAQTSLREADNFIRGNLGLFFPAIPLINGMKKRFPIEGLDRVRFFWWWDIIAARDVQDQLDLRDVVEEATSPTTKDSCFLFGPLQITRRTGFIDGVLTPYETKHFEAHMAVCASCRQAVREIRETFP